jgi:hypothetical protein
MQRVPGEIGLSLQDAHDLRTIVGVEEPYVDKLDCLYGFTSLFHAQDT